jgi:hypothetical protein
MNIATKGTKDTKNENGKVAIQNRILERRICFAIFVLFVADDFLRKL